MHNHYCSEEQSKVEAYALRKRTSVLDQLVSQLARDLEATAPGREDAAAVEALDGLVDSLRNVVGDGGVIVVGGGYLGQKARAGSKRTPVVQVILKKLAKHFRVVVVDEVGACERVRGWMWVCGTGAVRNGTLVLHCGCEWWWQYLTSKMCCDCGTRMEQSSARGFLCSVCNQVKNR